MAVTGSIKKFDPEKISQCATYIKKEQARLEKALEGAGRSSASLKTIWRGESADTYREKIETLDKLGVNLVRMMASFAQELETVSGIYSRGESDAVQASEGLPADGVFLI